jgi:hypothetical protein
MKSDIEHTKKFYFYKADLYLKRNNGAIEDLEKVLENMVMIW